MMYKLMSTTITIEASQINNQHSESEIFHAIYIIKHGGDKTLIKNLPAVAVILLASTSRSNVFILSTCDWWELVALSSSLVSF